MSGYCGMNVAEIRCSQEIKKCQEITVKQDIVDYVNIWVNSLGLFDNPSHHASQCSIGFWTSCSLWPRDSSAQCEYEESHRCDPSVVFSVICLFMYPLPCFFNYSQHLVTRNSRGYLQLDWSTTFLCLLQMCLLLLILEETVKNMWSPKPLHVLQLRHWTIFTCETSWRSVSTISKDF